MNMPTEARHPHWKWYVCGLLLLATMLNYMDRQTLSTLSVRILKALELDEAQYGQIEMGFGLAFAGGALVFGYLADRINVRWLYPIVLLAWSAVGFATAWARDFNTLLACRVLLGFFEAGQWPCALKTSQRLLSRRDRTLGNSILQSGASLGAIITPLLAMALLRADTTSWGLPFQVIGALGVLWLLPWFWLVRTHDLDPATADSAELPPTDPEAYSTAQPTLSRLEFIQRFLILTAVVISINFCWHFFRAWMPMFLRNARGYTENEVNVFTSFYYAATDVGCISTGVAVRLLCAWGWRVHSSRVAIFLVCCLLTSLSWLVTLTPAGPGLLGMLLLIGFGSMGLFPIYYALTQDISVRNLGKVTGTLSCITWTCTAVMQNFVGESVKASGSFDSALKFVGLAPFVGFAVLAIFWRDRSEQTE